ncbi:hypothetical protein ACOMHN_050109 [Nucella lapillus]
MKRYPDFSTSDVSPTVVSEPDVLATGPLAEGRFVDEHFGAGPLADERFVDEHFGAGPLADVKCATPLYKITFPPHVNRFKPCNNPSIALPVLTFTFHLDNISVCHLSHVPSR